MTRYTKLNVQIWDKRNTGANDALKSIFVRAQGLSGAVIYTLCRTDTPWAFFRVFYSCP